VRPVPAVTSYLIEIYEMSQVVKQNRFDLYKASLKSVRGEIPLISYKRVAAVIVKYGMVLVSNGSGERFMEVVVTSKLLADLRYV